ncbi:MAG: energy transducer TonB [Vicingaceae bacterium]|nr:energy transducer TonB [Vicingaceae bacterium]
MPEYPGGTRALIKFFQTNVQYPDSAREESIQGKVYVTFVVDTIGKIDDVSIIRGVHPLLDKEAIRVVQKNA